MHQETYHLVHANIAIARAPLDHPIMAGFVDQVDRVNYAAQVSPRFVAQPKLPDEGEVFTSVEVFPYMIVGWTGYVPAVCRSSITGT